MFPSFATREALFSASILFPRSKFCFCFTAEVFPVSAYHVNVAKRGNNYGNMFPHFAWPLRPGKTRKHVSRNTCSACMFPQCFPVLPHGKHCFQGQFCFQKAKCAAATRQKHFVFPPGIEATGQNEETITETCFWKYVSLFCQGLSFIRQECRNHALLQTKLVKSN